MALPTVRRDTDAHLRAVRLAPSLYELGDSLGRGSMGVVYRALHKVSGGSVALKRVRRAPALDAQSTTPGTSTPASGIGLPELRLALAREFRTLATLRHPNIISVYDFGFDSDGEPFFTMELLDRPTSLLQAVRGLGFQERVTLLLEAVDALAYLHRHGLVHRDLKPSNIAVANQHVKLLDFGVSSKTFGSDIVVGTVRYMAPEVLRGEPAETASDLFSFGVVAYQCLVGRHPFESANDETLTWKVLNVEPDLLPFGQSPISGVFSPAPGEAETPTVVVRAGAREMPAPASSPTSTETEDEAYGLDLSLVDEAARATLGQLLSALLSKDASARTSAERVAQVLASVIGRTLAAADETRSSFATAARFVGRQNELRALGARLDQLTNELRGGSCLVGGESGVGKSRLVDEVRTLALVRGITVVTGQAAAESTTPFDVWVSILRWLVLTLRDANLAAIVAPWVPDLASAFDAPLPTVPALTGVAAQRRLLGAVEAGLRRLALPTLFILEDLHWAGSESLSLLKHLRSKAGELRLLVLGTFRDDENTTLGTELAAIDQMRLGRHTFAEIRELSEAMLGQAGTSFAFAEFLFHETEGNAFLATEVARSIPPTDGPPSSSQTPAAGSVAPAPASLTTAASMEAAPRISRLDSVRRILDRRLAKIEGDARRLLEIAAVAGRGLDPPLLCDVTGRSRRAIDELALEVTASGVFEAIGAEYRFRHDKFREAILDAMPEEEHRQVHLRIADALERRIAGREVRGDMAGRLAHHLTSGGEGARALPYLQAAATDAIARYANKEAVRYLETAIAIIESGRAGAPDAQRLFVLHKLLAPALIATRGYAATEVTSAYARARELAVTLGLGPADVFPVNFGLWLYELVRGDMRASLVAARACMTDARAKPLESRAAGDDRWTGEPQGAPDADLAVEAYRAMGATSYYLGRFESADAHLRRALSVHDPVRHADHGFRFGGDPGVVCRLYLSLTCCFRGRADEAVGLADEALATARTVRHPFSEAYALGFRAWTFQLLGDVEGAAESAQRATLLSEEHGFPFWVGFGTMLDGWTRIHRGAEEAREGDRLMRRALDILRATGAGLWESYWRVLLAEAAIARGAFRDATSLIEAGVAHADKMGELFVVPLLLTEKAIAIAGATGTAPAKPDEPREAVECLERARLLAIENQDRLGALRASRERVRLVRGSPLEASAAATLAEDRRPFEGQRAARFLLGDD